MLPTLLARCGIKKHPATSQLHSITPSPQTHRFMNNRIRKYNRSPQIDLAVSLSTHPGILSLIVYVVRSGRLTFARLRVVASTSREPALQHSRRHSRTRCQSMRHYWRPCDERTRHPSRGLWLPMRSAGDSGVTIAHITLRNNGEPRP